MCEDFTLKVAPGIFRCHAQNITVATPATKPCFLLNTLFYFIYKIKILTCTDLKIFYAKSQLFFDRGDLIITKSFNFLVNILLPNK